MTRLEARGSRIIEGRSPQQVWDFIAPPESALLTSPDVVRAFKVPGTGPGMGEQQCFIRCVDGRELPQLVTVVAVEEAVYAETVSSDDVPLRSRFEVEAVDGGTRLVLTSIVEVAEGMPINLEATREAMSAGADAYVGRVKALLEAPPPEGLWT